MSVNNSDNISVYLGPPERIGVRGDSIRGYQDHMLEIIREVDRICAKHGIDYFLLWGTLIGTVRERKFLPWDDDADIGMTRDNYNRFLRACETDLAPGFSLALNSSPDGSHTSCSRICRDGTTFIAAPYVSRHGRGSRFFIDLMVFDYFSENLLYQKIQARCILYRYRLVNPGFSLRCGMSLTWLDNAVIAVAKKLLGLERCMNLIIRVLSATPKEKAFRTICDQVNLLGVFYPKEHFENCPRVPFEGGMFPVPNKPLSFTAACYEKVQDRSGWVFPAAYADENDAVARGQLFRFMHILIKPSAPGRIHPELVYDARRDVSYYDRHYLGELDLKRNDRAAVRGRRAREKLHVADGRLFKEISHFRDRTADAFLARFLDSSRPMITALLADRDFSALVRVCDVLKNSFVQSVPTLPPVDFSIVLDLFVRRGDCLTAQLLATRFRFLYPGTCAEEHAEILEAVKDFSRAECAMYEERDDVVRAILEKYTAPAKSPDGWYAMLPLLKSCLAAGAGRLDEAENLLRPLVMDEALRFHALYHLGLVRQAKNDNATALACFLDAVNATDMVPYIILAADRAREISSRDNLPPPLTAYDSLMRTVWPDPFFRPDHASNTGTDTAAGADGKASRYAP